LFVTGWLRTRRAARVGCGEERAASIETQSRCAMLLRNHRLRDDRDFERHVDYIPPTHQARMGARAGDWRHSSFHANAPRGLYPADWACDPHVTINGGECTWIFPLARCVYPAREQSATTSHSKLHCEESQRRYRVQEACIAADNPCVMGIYCPQLTLILGTCMRLITDPGTSHPKDGRTRRRIRCSIYPHSGHHRRQACPGVAAQNGQNAGGGPKQPQ